jgi:hypothetical protein
VAEGDPEEFKFVSRLEGKKFERTTLMNRLLRSSPRNRHGISP